LHFTEDASAFERRLIDRAARARSPINGSLELTPICNMQCEMCYVRLTPAEAAQQGGLRSVEEWLDIARQMRDAGTLFLLLTGGEPLLYPEFRRLYLGLIKLGMLITINTNGTLIDEDWADFFAQNRPRRINITLYGPDEETYASLCHYPGGFQKTIRGVRLLRERGVEVRLSISATPHNAPHIDRMMDIAKELDAALAVETYILPATRERTLPFDRQARLSPEQAAQLRIRFLKRDLPGERFIRFARENVWAVQHAVPDPKANRMRCLAGSCSFTINWQGQMRPCVIMTQPCADVAAMGMSAAWQHIRTQADAITLSPQCSACRLRTICRNCAASAMAETGSFDGTAEYTCRYTQELYRLLLDELSKAEKE